MNPARHILAIAAGIVLGTLPFWRYLPIGASGEAHTDHEPRHGGQLGMVGDHHIEVRRRRGRVEAFVSDAGRRPVRPSTGWVVFDRSAHAALQWENHRLVGEDRSAAREIEAVVDLSDGTRLALSFDFSEP